MASLVRSYEDLLPKVAFHPGSRKGGNTGYDDAIAHLLEQLHPAWHQEAACRGKTELFFVNRNETTEPAKALCRICPVREACLQTAVERNELAGVWGGLSVKDRRPVRRFRASRSVYDPDPPHGSLNRYKNHGCRCEECRTSHSRYRQARREQGLGNSA
jgi:WhiB family redox-sensing transcriptional regulator